MEEVLGLYKIHVGPWLGLSSLQHQFPKVLSNQLCTEGQI
jgi:hypothetical protein